MGNGSHGKNVKAFSSGYDLRLQAAAPVPESIPATLHHSHPNKTTEGTRGNSSEPLNQRLWKASSACEHLACAKNSHFLAISTETVDGTWPSNPIRNVGGCVQMHLAEKAGQHFQLKHLYRNIRGPEMLFGATGEI
ncbi:Hypothetical predicted protein [Xyrichtys novacula]|uniref:Uncharacterized protein n=1 Tax=Xyrichtys novacula TaxID=13765 RepID=A0AAV1F5K8_XYRNO|nr:Hypothetical predicted protein [Xyrichtys novacula]